jgi:hypothetical protein
MSFLNVTGVDPKELAKAAYRFSRLQGLGFLHAKEGELSDEEAQTLVNHGRGEIVLSMDYVHGRACKFTVWQRNGQLFIRDSWFDHSPYDLQDLLDAVGKKDAAKFEELPERIAA